MAIGRAAVLLLALTAACARLPAARPLPGAPPPPGVAALTAEQTLYRVQYQGEAGGGSLRLVLRRQTDERFQIQTSDTLGRALWSLDFASGSALLVDHRERVVCTAGSELRVPEVALAPLPLSALPRVLAGRAPLLPPAPVADPLDWIDAAGRRWSLRRDGDEIVSWMMWRSGEPQLWWQRQPRGGILSHREGSQFRWRTVVSEPLAAGVYRPLQAPPEYRRELCGAAANTDQGLSRHGQADPGR